MAPVRGGRLLAALLGLAAAAFALWLYGRGVMDPRSIGWLLHGDPAQHFLGSVFFQGEPWHWPPGLITRFGDAPTSVVFTDAIPLLALAAKALGMPAGLQYFGLWMLACHVLAAVCGLALLRRLGVTATLALSAGAFFFVVSPALLLRAYGHEALMGHFLVVAALERALAPWRWGPWLALASVAACVHPYLAFMVGLLGAGAGVAAWVEGTLPWPRLIAQGGVSLAVLGAVTWAVGYYAGSGEISAAGHTFFSANALTWIDPMDWAAFMSSDPERLAQSREWTRWLPHWRQATGGQYEGFAYLGAGALAVVVLALVLPAVARARGGEGAAPVPRARWIAAIAVCFFFALLALSARPSVGAHVLAQVPLAPWADKLLGVFRASGRFIWPATYLLLAWALARVGRHRWGGWLLALCLLAQLADLQDKFREFRFRFRHGPPNVEQPLASPVWREALARCPDMEIVTTPPGSRWTAPALAAALAGARFHPAPTARVSPQAAQERQAEVVQLIAQARWRQDTVYLLSPPLPRGLRIDAVAAALPSGLRHVQADGYDLAVPLRCLGR